MAQTSTGTGEKNRILIKVNMYIYKKNVYICYKVMYKEIIGRCEK